MSFSPNIVGDLQELLYLCSREKEGVRLLPTLKFETTNLN